MKAKILALLIIEFLMTTVYAMEIVVDEPAIIGNFHLENTTLVIKDTSNIVIRNISLRDDNEMPCLILQNVSDVLIENSVFARCSVGIKIIESSNVTIKNSMFRGNLYCYWKSEFAGDANCNGGAISIASSDGIKILDNSYVPDGPLFSNIYCIKASYSKNLLIKGNYLSDYLKCYPTAAFGGYCKGGGVILSYVKNATIIRNSFQLVGGDNVVSILLDHSKNIWIYLNNFYGNPVGNFNGPGARHFENKLSEFSMNTLPVRYNFSNMIFTGVLGNYWSYIHAKDGDGDGIADYPFMYDAHPLAYPAENYQILSIIEVKNKTGSFTNITTASSNLSVTFQNEEQKHTINPMLIYLSGFLSGIVLFTAARIIWRKVKRSQR